MLNTTVTIKIFLFTFIILDIKNIYSNDLSYTETIPVIPNYLSVRALGMGSANVAVASDEHSIFDNPAGISLVNMSQKNITKIASLPNITYSTNAYSFNLMNQNYNYYTYPYGLIEKSTKDLDKKNVIFSRISTFPTVVLGYFQFGILLDSYESGYTTALETPQLSTNNSATYDRTFTEFRRDQAGLVSGFYIPFSKSFIFGISTRLMFRETRTNTIEANQSGLILESKTKAEKNTNSTNGTAVDLGILMPFKVSLSPKIGVSILDVGDTIYHGNNASSQAETEKMNIKAGLSLNPVINKYFGTIFSLEVERINDQRVNDRNKIRGGWELNLGSHSSSNAPFSIRLGYGNQTVSAGVSLFLVFAKFEFATYGESVSISDDAIIDRRYAARITIDLVR